MTGPILLLITVAFSLWVAASGGTVTAKGRILCNGEPIRWSRISLMDNDPVFDDRMARGQTDGQGYFEITGEASDPSIVKSWRRPDVYIMPHYSHDSSWVGKFQVEPSPVKLHDKSKTFKNKKGTVEMGELDFSTQLCKAYLTMYAAMEDYKDRVGETVPLQIKVVGKVVISGGLPFTDYTKIKIPDDYTMSQETARHELAHAIRHHYDGNRAHFIADVIKYTYLQNHTCMKKTNKGFAFNEGWAIYWAKDNSCINQGDPEGNKQREGHVAAALKELQDRCRTSNKDMWEVLRRSRGGIHSFDQYRDRHDVLIGCNELPPGAPKLSIIEPTDECEPAQNPNNVLLRGKAFENEDSSIDISSDIEWYTDRTDVQLAFLGQGESMTVELDASARRPGSSCEDRSHLLTAKVTNSAAVTTEEEVLACYTVVC